MHVIRIRLSADGFRFCFVFGMCYGHGRKSGHCDTMIKCKNDNFNTAIRNGSSGRGVRKSPDLEIIFSGKISPSLLSLGIRTYLFKR